MQENKVAFFIGRFMLPHIAHIRTIVRALDSVDRVVVILGSCGRAITSKNPFTSSERQQMIVAGLRTFLSDRRIEQVSFRETLDYSSDTVWVSAINQIILDETQGNTKNAVLLGCDKDASTFYFKLFPNITKMLNNYSQLPSMAGINSTNAREILFTIEDEDSLFAALKDAGVLARTIDFIMRWRETESFTRMKEEFEFIKAYKKSWEAAPYPPTFVTADAVVLQAGHVLMVKRKAAPGRGLLALPGGFVGQDERIEAAAIRELKEETNIDLSENTLQRCIKSSKVFDSPWRSLRGRTITHAFLFQLAETGSFPKIKAADDAEDAMWVPISNLANLSDKIFEDHADIIYTMTSVNIINPVR